MKWLKVVTVEGPVPPWIKGNSHLLKIEEGITLTLPEDIFFDFDSAQLRSEAEEAIDKLVYIAE